MNKFARIVKQNANSTLGRAVVVVGTGFAVAPAAFAQAALPTGVAAAITEAGEMLVLGATAVIVAMVAFWGVKKLGTKMGWF